MTQIETLDDVTVVDDAEVISLLLTMCKTETSAGRLAQAKGADEQVVATGDKLVVEHDHFEKAVDALATKNGLAPKDNSLARFIDRKGSDADAECAALEGSAFDKAFLDSEIRVHEFARYLVSAVLLRDVRNPDLKALLADALPSVDENLAAVRSIRASLV